MADKRRTVWITGASSGLGRYTAQALGEAGFCVIAGARSFTGDKAADGIFRLPLDVTREESVEAFQKAALAISERVDAVVHCAGVLVLGPCEKVPVEEYRRVLETNYLGVVRMNQAVLPLMREQGGGKIIIFSSINGLLARLYVYLLLPASMRWRAMRSAWPWRRNPWVSRCVWWSQGIIAAAARLIGRISLWNRGHPMRRRWNTALP